MELSPGQTPYLWRAKSLTVLSREPSGSINSILPSHHGNDRLTAFAARICSLRGAVRANESLPLFPFESVSYATTNRVLGMVEGVGFEPT